MKVKECNVTFSLECQNACGTRHFRTCCFNYLRKRSSTPPLLTNRINPYDVAEMWLARAMKHNAMLRAPVDSWYDSASDSDMSNEVRRPQGVGKFMVYTDEGSKNSGKGGDESAETVGGRAVLYDS